MSYDDGLPPGWGGVNANRPLVVGPDDETIPIAAGFAVFLGGLFGALTASMIGLAIGFYDVADLTSLDAPSDGLIRFLIVSSAGQFLAMGLLLVMFSRVRGTGKWSVDYGLDIKGRDVFWMPLGTLVQIISIILVALLAEALGVEVPTQEAATAVEDSQSLGQQIALGILIVGVAPVVEEMLFRGLWLKAILAKHGKMAAVIATSVLFGLAHLLDPSAAFLVPALVLVGFVLAVVTLRKNRLGPAIMIHAGFNLTTFVLLLAPTFA